MASRAELESLSRSDLQSLCKKHGIKANGKTVDLIASLSEHILHATPKEPAELIPTSMPPTNDAPVDSVNTEEPPAASGARTSKRKGAPVSAPEPAKKRDTRRKTIAVLSENNRDSTAKTTTMVAAAALEAATPTEPVNGASSVRNEESTAAPILRHCVVHGVERNNGGDVEQGSAWGRLVLVGGRVYVECLGSVPNLPFVVRPLGGQAPHGCDDNLICQQCVRTNANEAALIGKRGGEQGTDHIAADAQNNARGIVHGSNSTAMVPAVAAVTGKENASEHANAAASQSKESIAFAHVNSAHSHPSHLHAAAPVAEMKDPSEEEVLRSRKSAIAEKRLSHFKTHRKNGAEFGTPRESRHAAIARLQSEKRLEAISRRRGIDIAATDSPSTPESAGSAYGTPSSQPRAIPFSLRQEAMERRRSVANGVREDGEVARKVELILTSTLKGSEDERRMSMEPSADSPVRRSPTRSRSAVRLATQQEARRNSLAH